MSFLTDIPEVEVGLDDVLTLLGIAHDESLSDQIKQLYKEADTLAVFTVKVVAALYWWTSHIASATGDAFNYAVQIQNAMATANKYELETWKQFLAIKHPTEIRRVYIRTTKRIEVTKKVMAKQQKVNLGPIKRELAALEKWKKNTVTPDLKKLMAFWHAWENTYKKPVVQWVQWFKKPSLFAKWAAMPLVVQLPTTLNNKGACKNVTAIEAALLATWVNDPQTVYNAVLDWLVTA